MSNKIVLLKYLGRMDVPDERDNRDGTVIAELLDLIERDKIECEGWHKDEGLPIDNHDDDDSPLAEDETIFEVRLHVNLPREDFYQDDITTKLLQYVAATLAETDLNGVVVNKAHISNCYEREHEPYTKTVIEITIA